MTTPTDGTPACFAAFENVAMERGASGVLTARFHADGGPVTFTGQAHGDVRRTLEAIARDRAEGTALDTALEGLIAADIAYQRIGR